MARKKLLHIFILVVFKNGIPFFFFNFLPRMLHQDVQLVIELKILEGVLPVNRIGKAELNVQKEVYSSAHVSMKKSLGKVNI